MKLLVTGASGFIGSHLIKILNEKHCEVHGIFLNRNPSKKLNNINWHKLDLFNQMRVEEFMREIQPTHIIHLAWNTEHGKFWTSSKNKDWVDASIRLFQLFKKYNGVKFISSGTKAEYGDFKEKYLKSSYEYKEDCAKNPNTLYGQSKNNLHKELKRLDEGSDRTLVWTRVFDTYGPGENEKKFCSYVIKNALNNKEVLCKNPYLAMDFLHVKDIAHAYIDILDSKYIGEINISSGKSVSLKYISEFLLNELNSINLLRLNHDSKDQYEIYGNNQILMSLGWIKKYEIEDGLIDLINFYKTK